MSQPFYPEQCAGNVNDPHDLLSFIDRQLMAISSTLQQIYNLEIRYVEPPYPREADVAFADGTSWNPGAGKGVYVYYDADWHKLG